MAEIDWPVVGDVVKGDLRPEVWHIEQDGARHWVPDPETLQQQFGNQSVKTVDQQRIYDLPVGMPVRSVKTPNQFYPDGALLGMPVAVLESWGDLDPSGSTNDLVAPGSRSVIDTMRNGWPAAYPDRLTFAFDGLDIDAVEIADQSWLQQAMPGR